MDWIVGIIAFALGATIAYLLAERKHRGQITQVALAEQRANDLAHQLDEEKSATESLRSNVTSLTANLRATDEKCAEQLKLLDDAQKRLSEAFASVSAEALQKNSEAFLTLAKEKFATISTEAQGSLDQRKTQIEAMLKPLRETLTELEQKRTSAYVDLKETLGAVSSTQKQLALETTQLVSALRRPQTRGQWGEFKLRRLFELAGMTARCDFVEQESIASEDGRQRPDAIIKLPGDRQIIIDCKTVLDAFLDAASAADDGARRVCLQRHAKQVRARAMDLAAKGYWNQFDDMPDFVIMFLPDEAFLYAAIEFDGALFEDSFKNNVIIATPTTLIALLKTIASGWQEQQIAQNAEEIRTLGKELYERLAVALNHFSKLGASIDQSVKVYNDVLGSMEARVTVTARKLSELGARTDKELPDLEPIDRQPRTLSKD